MIQSLGLLSALFLWPLFQVPLIRMIGEGATTKYILVSFLMVLLASIALMLKRKVLNSSIYSIYLIVFWVAVLIHLSYHFENIKFLEKYYIVLILLPIGALFVSIQADLSEKALKYGAVIISILYAFGLVSVLFSGGIGESGRAVFEGGTSGSVNYITIAALMLLITSLICNKKFVVFSFFVLLGALLITKSRGGFVTSAFILMFYVFVSREIGTKKKVVLFSFSIICLMFAYYFLGLSDRFLLSGVTDYDNPLGRLNILYDLFGKFIDSPIMGAGVATGFHIRYDSHNMILEMLLEGGLLLFITFIPVILETKNYNLYRSHSNSAFLIYFYFTILFVGGMFSGSFFLHSMFIITYFYLLRIKVEVLRGRKRHFHLKIDSSYITT